MSLFTTFPALCHLIPRPVSMRVFICIEAHDTFYPICITILLLHSLIFLFVIGLVVDRLVQVKEYITLSKSARRLARNTVQFENTVKFRG